MAAITFSVLASVCAILGIHRAKPCLWLTWSHVETIQRLMVVVAVFWCRFRVRTTTPIDTYHTVDIIQQRGGHEKKRVVPHGTSAARIVRLTAEAPKIDLKPVRCNCATVRYMSDVDKCGPDDEGGETSDADGEKSRLAVFISEPKNETVAVLPKALHEQVRIDFENCEQLFTDRLRSPSAISKTLILAIRTWRKAMLPSRKARYVYDRHWGWKFIVRLLGIVLAAAVIGCVAWAATSSRGVEDRDRYGFYGGLICLSLSILWNTFNVVVLVSRSRPVAPDANVGCDLLLWLLLLGTGILYALSARDNLPHDGEKGYFVGHLWQGIVKVAGSLFAFVVVIIHFALFASACRYVHGQRRRARLSNPTATMAPDSPPPSLQQQGFFAASDPPVLERPQSTYPLTNLRQPPEVPPIRVPRPTSSWIVPEPKANSVVYHLITSGHEVENHQSRGHQAEADRVSPVSPIVSPQSPHNPDFIVHPRLSGGEDRFRENDRGSRV
ncbi:hypothetical protein MMC07_009705 [Pseudocyphellaria aurata]|nr:hypothetical protein [Pseudocyphellaria aurata]